MANRPAPFTLLHPIRAWRAYIDRITYRADTEARLAGLTVTVLPGGRRRYRDPRADLLPARVARTIYVETAAWGPVTYTRSTAADAADSSPQWGRGVLDPPLQPQGSDDRYAAAHGRP